MFLLCLILASVSWIFTSLNETFTSSYEYKIAYTKMPKDKVPSIDLPTTLSAELEGSGWDLFQYTRKKTSNVLNINLSTIENDLVSESYLKGILYNELPNYVEIYKMEPKEISVQFEQEYSKKIPVILNHQITFKDGYFKKTAISVKPDSITITGAKSVIQPIKDWPTDTIKLNEVAKTVEKTLEIMVPDNIILNEDDYLVDIKIEVVQYTEKKMDIPVAFVNTIDTNFLIIPSSIELKCLVPVDEYDKILPEDFRLEADYENNVYKGKIDVTIVRQHEFAKQVSFYPNEVSFILIEDE